MFCRSVMRWWTSNVAIGWRYIVNICIVITTVSGRPYCSWIMHENNVKADSLSALSNWTRSKILFYWVMKYTRLTIYIWTFRYLNVRLPEATSTTFNLSRCIYTWHSRERTAYLHSQWICTTQNIINTHTITKLKAKGKAELTFLNICLKYVIISRTILAQNKLPGVLEIYMNNTYSDIQFIY